MRRLLLAVVVVLLLAGCGAGSPSAADQAKSDQRSCAKLTASARTAMAALNSRLDVGLVYADYSVRVGDVKVAYDKIEQRRSQAKDDGAKDPAASIDCINKVIVPLEAAMGAYTQAASKWNSCNQSSYCSTPDLQGLWTTASTKLERARTGLAAVGRA